MTYSIKTIHDVKNSPKTLGNTLGRLAVDLDFSVMRIAKATGATRQTVYNWFFGGEVLNPYKPMIEQLIQILQSARSADKAWETVCKEFNLQG